MTTVQTAPFTADPAALPGDAIGRSVEETPAWRTALGDPESPAMTYAGLLLLLVGFSLLFVGWGGVAGKANVYQQIPYLLSAGFPGIGLILSGLVTINVAARRADAVQRRRQITLMAQAVEALTQERGDTR